MYQMMNFALSRLPLPPCRTLLVVNDLERTRTLMQLLAEHGHAVVPTPTVAGAFERLQTWAPHCCIVDLALPDQSGIEVLRQVRMTSREVAVVLLCDDVDSVEAAEARAHEPVVCFRNPVDPALFGRWLDAWGKAFAASRPAQRSHRRSPRVA